MKEEIIRLENIYLNPGDSNVYNKFRFNIFKGEILGLLSLYGVNTSFLTKLLTGNAHTNKGLIFVNDIEIYIKNQLHAQKLGIFYISRDNKLVPQLSISTNLFAINSNSRILINPRKNNLRTKKIFEDFELPFDSNLQTWHLSQAEKNIIEIIKAYIEGAKLIILDDIISNYTESELNNLIKLVYRLKNYGISFLILSHNIDYLIVMSDRITIMRDGLNTFNINRIDFNKELIYNILLGDQRKAFLEYSPRELGNISVTFDFLTEFIQEPIKINLHKFEILGILDIEEKLKNAKGLLTYNKRMFQKMNIFIEGKHVVPKNFSDLLNAGFGVIFPNSVDYNIFDNLTIAENLSLLIENKLHSSIFKNYRTIQKTMLNELAAMHNNIVNCKTVNELDYILRYELIMEKWQAYKPKVLLFTNPFSEIDDFSKIILFKHLINLADSGTGIIIISPIISLISALCDNIIVPYRNKPYRLFTNSEFRNANIDEFY